MPRRKREISKTGIYHVMLRGINKQDIFFKEDDFLHVMRFIRDIPFRVDKLTHKVVSSDQCTIYAYCMLHNHMHLLIREGELSISEIMKKIEVSYAIYYNLKSERIGHLFQGRFQSEPVNDLNYFYTAFCYIARNPVKAEEAKRAEAYPYSSWNEFTGHKSNLLRVLKPEAIQAVLKQCPLTELKARIKADSDDHCLDMDDFFRIKSDKEAWDTLSDITGFDNPEDFRLLDQQTQIYYLLQAIDKGVNLSQASRLGTLSRFQLTRAYNQKCGDSLAMGSDPDVSFCGDTGAGIRQGGHSEKVKAGERIAGHEEEMEAPERVHMEIRWIHGLGRLVYHRLHLIVDYLYRYGDSKCQDIALAVDSSSESVRRSLMLLSNNNIVEVRGKARARTYRLDQRWQS